MLRVYQLERSKRAVSLVRSIFSSLSVLSVLSKLSPLTDYALYARRCYAFPLNFVPSILFGAQREDFCGTAFIAAEWAKSDYDRTAVGTS